MHFARPYIHPIDVRWFCSLLNPQDWILILEFLQFLFAKPLKYISSVTPIINIFVTVQFKIFHNLFGILCIIKCNQHPPTEFHWNFCFKGITLSCITEATLRIGIPLIQKKCKSQKSWFTILQTLIYREHLLLILLQLFCVVFLLLSPQWIENINLLDQFQFLFVFLWIWLHIQ